MKVNKNSIEMVRFYQLVKERPGGAVAEYGGFSQARKHIEMLVAQNMLTSGEAAVHIRLARTGVQPGDRSEFNAEFGLINLGNVLAHQIPMVSC